MKSGRFLRVRYQRVELMIVADPTMTQRMHHHSKYTARQLLDTEISPESQLGIIR